jgi:hypothetical protein
MDIIIFLLIIIFVALIVTIFILFKNSRPEKHDSGSLLLIQQQISKIVEAVDTKLSESNKNTQEQFKYSADIIRNVKIQNREVY